jgi:hypothetical protein
VVTRSQHNFTNDTLAIVVLRGESLLAARMRSATDAKIMSVERLVDDPSI